MIDRGDIRQAIDRCSNIWASLPGAGYGQFEHKGWLWPDCKIQRSGRNGQRDDVWAESPRLSPLWLSASSSRSWAVNHYRDNAITYKAQRDKNARELKLANAAITDMQMRQRDVAALDAKYTKELADAKAENDALRDDVAAGRRRLPASKQSVDQCVKPPPPPAWIMQPPPTGRHRWTGLFHPQRGWSCYAKTTGRNPEVWWWRADDCPPSLTLSWLLTIFFGGYNADGQTNNHLRMFTGFLF